MHHTDVALQPVLEAERQVAQFALERFVFFVNAANLQGRENKEKRHVSVDEMCLRMAGDGRSGEV